MPPRSFEPVNTGSCARLPARLYTGRRARRIPFRTALPEQCRLFAGRLQNRDAVRAFLEARELAARQQDPEMDGVVSLNLASVYLQMGEWSGARDEVRRALGSLEKVPGSRFRAQALVQSAKLRTRSGDFSGALPEYLDAIREADARGDVGLQALAANLLGFEFLRLGRLDEAEGAMFEAFRLRLLHRKGDLPQSYHALAMLRLAQGDAHSADTLIEREVEATERDPGRVPNWGAYHARGERRAAEGRLPEALRDFRTALELAREWRLELLPFRCHAHQRRGDARRSVLLLHPHCRRTLCTYRTAFLRA